MNFRALLFKDQLLYGSCTKGVGLVVLWSRKEYVTKNLPLDSYTVCGQLYSRHQGVNALIVNCLANKSIRYLIVTGLDLTSSGEVLSKLFELGVNEKREVNGMEGFTLDENIPIEEFNSFRENVKLIDLRKEKSFENISKLVDSLSKQNAYGENVTLQLSAPRVPNVFPSREIGNVIYANSIATAWKMGLRKIFRFGALKRTEYDEDSREVQSLFITVNNSHNEWNDELPFSKTELEEYIPQVVSAVKVDGVEYTYGERLRGELDQISIIIEKLSKTPYSRRFVASAWTPRRDLFTNSPPCLVSLQFSVLENKVHLFVFMRSSDFFAAWPKNAFAYNELLKEVAQKANLQAGSLAILSQCAHVYAHDYEKALNVVKKQSKYEEWNPDPQGNLVVSLREEEIYIHHVAQSGKLLGEFHGKTAIEIYRYIANQDIISVISHALDIGCELQKAEIALKLGVKYVQDKPLELKISL